MSVRRTSGEVVNATLLETFLALVFLIFGLAAFTQQEADQAPSQATVDSLDAVIDSLRRHSLAEADSLRGARTSRDSLRGVLLSKYPPDCEPNAIPSELLTITLLGPNQLHVLANRAEFGLERGVVLDLTPSAFLHRFEPARAEGERRRCRYLVRVEDTNGMDKQQFKDALRVINSVFRPRDFLR